VKLVLFSERGIKHLRCIVNFVADARNARKSVAKPHKAGSMAAYSR
jgi:hypothetical protein